MATQYQTEDKLSEKTQYWDLAKRIFPFAKKYWVFFTFLFVVVILHTVIGRILPTLFGQVIDKVIIAKQLDLLWKFCSIYLVLEIVRFSLICAETYFFQLLGLNIIYDMRSGLFKHVQDLPVKFFDKNPVGRIITRLTNDFSSLSDLFTAGLVSVFVDSISLIAIIIAMLLIDIKLTLVVMALAPVMLWTCFYLSSKARDTLRVIKKSLAALNSFLAENISGMKITQLYNQQLRQSQFFGKMNQNYKDEQIKNLNYLAWLHPVLNGFNAIAVAIALYYGGLLSSDSAIPVGLLIAFLMHVQDFLPPLRNILEKYQTFQSSLASAERIFTLFDEQRDNLEGSTPNKHFSGEIEFKNVTYTYTKENEPVLKNISFKILPGQSVAVIGSTGSGKSTIISLVQRLYNLESTDSGQIFIDGMDISTIDKRELRRRIGVVQQEFFLFKGTLLSNITLNDPHISTERALQAAQAAQCQQIIDRIGLEGHIQERGANLSAGERQLINFARIIAFNADILILDEATANIDAESERMIKSATQKITENKTSIIIAHRLSTIENCDRVFDISGGTLIERTVS